MDMWKMEQYEIGQEAYEEMEAWFAYEADMAKADFEYPSEEELEEMCDEYSKAKMAWQDWVLEF